MHPDLKLILDRAIKDRTNIDHWSRNCYRQFNARFNMRLDDKARTLYREMFDYLQRDVSLRNVTHKRRDKGKRSIGTFALNLIDNDEVLLWKHVWPLVQPKMNLLYPNIPLDWEYDGLSEDPCVIFYPDEAKAGNPDIRIVHQDTRRRVASVEIKDGAIFERMATYKDGDISRYVELDDMFVMTAYRKENKHGPLMAFSWMDKQDLVSMLDAEFKFSCPWFNDRDVYCFHKYGMQYPTRPLHPCFDWNTGAMLPASQGKPV